MRKLRTKRFWTGTLIVACIAAGALLAAQGPQGNPLPLEPSRERGASITPAYEGWYPNADGTFTMLFGYFNRNAKETLDIPIGPNNKIEPGPPDQGQPTHFEIGRQWGVFTIKVPKDFGTKKLTWTIVSGGETQSIPFTLNGGYTIAPFKEIGMGNEPPTLFFSQGGPKFTGPPVGLAATLTGTVNTPVELNVWAEDKKGSDQVEGAGRGRGRVPMVATVSFHKLRGPGNITFAPSRATVAKPGDSAKSNATFSAPGEYIVRVQANDESGEGGAGFQCCWTNAHVKVTIR
jgi:hypothetical protein